MNSSVFGAFLLFFTLLSVGYGLRCFECNSVEHDECKNLTSNDTNSKFLIDCSTKPLDGRQPFCRKVVHILVSEAEHGDGQVTHRSCGYLLDDTMTYNEDKCFKQDADHLKKKSCVCFTDACNTASAIYNAVNATAKFLILAAILFYAT